MTYIILEKLKDQFEIELASQRANAILLVPVFVAIGVGAYFSFFDEPPWGYSIVALLVASSWVFFARGLVRVACIGLLFIAIGYSVAQLRTYISYTPIITNKLNFKVVEGDIERIERLDKGVRITLSDVVVEDLEGDKTPRKVRLKLWKGEGFEVGQRISGLTSLHPPSPPVIPGGFDFQQYMYFRGIGAVGFFYKVPDILQEATGYGWLEALRHGIGARIEGALDPPQSGLATALMIGQRTSIDEEDMEAIRAAGLAHMLAISGLHVGLFSGVIFFFARFAMSAFPFFALRHPIKKYAAIIALVGAFFYMLIAGATIPTQRAMISVAVVFAAILLDRSPISLRVVAFAALCVLLIFPESLMSASFQMSFAAVTGLIAFFDWTRRYWTEWARQAGWGRKVALYVGGVATTTIVATIFTAPLTLYHFQALPSYGLLANVVCVPLLAFAVMPLAILAFLLMPIGLEGYALWVMKPALSVVLDLAHWVGDLEGAVFHVPAFSLGALVFFVLASLSVIVLKARLRIICVAVFCLCALLNFQWIQYDLFVSSKVDVIAMRVNEPQLIVSNRRKGTFERKNWEEAMGLAGSKAEVFPKEGDMNNEVYKVSCDGSACRAELKGRRVSYIKRFDYSAFEAECAWADIVVSKDIYKRKCDAQYDVNRGDGKYHGTHAFTLGDKIVLTRTEDLRGDRPWVQVPKSRWKD